MNSNRRRNFRPRSQKSSFRRRNGSLNSSNSNNLNGNGNLNFNRNGSMNNIHNVEKTMLKYQQLAKDAQDGTLHRPHRVNPANGMYRGRQVLDIEV